jgi:hypothetical protein
MSDSIILDAIRRNEGEAGSRVRKSARRVAGRNPNKATAGTTKAKNTVEVPVEEAGEQLDLPLED